MKTKILIWTGLLVLSLTSCSYLAPAPVDTAVISEKTWYNMYAESKLSADKINILQFHADWCPNCRSLEKNILSQEIPENINILKVDYDKETALKEKYGVTMQTTSVQVDGNGEMIKKWSKSATLDELIQEIEMPSEKMMDSQKEETMMEKSEWSEEEMKKMEAEVSVIEKDDMMDFSKEETMKKDDMIKKDEMMKEEAMVKTGMYSDYSADKLSATDKNVLFFHASWCPACVWANKNFMNSEIPENVNLLKVDYDNSTDLKEKYGVTMQHTFVLVDNKWEMIKKWSGSNDVKDLEMRVWE